MKQFKVQLITIKCPQSKCPVQELNSGDQGDIQLFYHSAQKQITVQLGTELVSL